AHPRRQSRNARRRRPLAPAHLPRNALPQVTVPLLGPRPNPSRIAEGFGRGPRGNTSGRIHFTRPRPAGYTSAHMSIDSYGSSVMRHPFLVVVVCALGASPVSAQDTKPDAKVKLEGHRGGVTALAFAPDGETIATGSGNGVVRLWDPHTGEVQVKLDPVSGTR